MPSWLMMYQTMNRSNHDADDGKFIFAIINDRKFALHTTDRINFASGSYLVADLIKEKKLIEGPDGKYCLRL